MALNILIIGLVVFVAHLLVLVFQKTRVPDVLVLMVGGAVAGPLLGYVDSGRLGVAGPVITTIALIVILFESGLNLRLDTLRAALGQTLLISLTTWLVTALIVTGLMHALTPVSWSMAAMTGAILGGTSSAVVVPLIEGLAMQDKPRTVLFLESALTDVLCIVGAMAMLSVVQGGKASVGSITISIGASLGVALVIGVATAFVWSLALGIIRKIPNTIFLTVASVFVVYGIAELAGFSGAIAALAFGVTLSSLGGVRLSVGSRAIELKELGQTDRLFFAETVFLLKTFFFVFLGMSLRFDSYLYVLVGVALVAPVYGARFFLVRWFASRAYSRRDVSLMTTMVPKGLAAAVLATVPAQHGLEHAEWVSGTVYMVVLLSIALTAALVLLIEKTSVGAVYAKALGPFAPNPASDLTTSVETAATTTGAEPSPTVE